MIRVVLIGMGPLGQRILKHAVQRDGLQIVATVDSDPAKVGRDAGEFCGVGFLGVAVQESLSSALRGKKVDVAILATVSSLCKLEQSVAEIAKTKLPIVSTCEELSYPWDKQNRLAKRIDAVCRKNGVACVGTGVNPGFLMDYLPSVLTSVCNRVDRVEVSRFQDASVRRVPFQKKIGAGLTLAEFKAMVRRGTLRHVGLVESMHMIAAALGRPLDRVTESLRPVVAGKKITSGYMPIRKGMACGVEQIGSGFVGGKEIIRLHFRAAVGLPESYDRIVIKGEPDVTSTIKGGVHGDIATCAIALNTLHSALSARPGLRTMLDIGVPGCRSDRS